MTEGYEEGGPGAQAEGTGQPGAPEVVGTQPLQGRHLRGLERAKVQVSLARQGSFAVGGPKAVGRVSGVGAWVLRKISWSGPRPGSN